MPCWAGTSTSSAGGRASPQLGEQAAGQPGAGEGEGLAADRADDRHGLAIDAAVDQRAPQRVHPLVDVCGKPVGLILPVEPRRDGIELRPPVRHERYDDRRGDGRVVVVGGGGDGVARPDDEVGAGGGDRLQRGLGDGEGLERDVVAGQDLLQLRLGSEPGEHQARLDAQRQRVERGRLVERHDSPVVGRRLQFAGAGRHPAGGVGAIAGAAPGSQQRRQDEARRCGGDQPNGSTAPSQGTESGESTAGVHESPPAPTPASQLVARATESKASTGHPNISRAARNRLPCPPASVGAVTNAIPTQRSRSSARIARRRLICSTLPGEGPAAGPSAERASIMAPNRRRVRHAAAS